MFKLVQENVSYYDAIKFLLDGGIIFDTEFYYKIESEQLFYFHSSSQEWMIDTDYIPSYYKKCTYSLYEQIRENEWYKKASNKNPILCWIWKRSDETRANPQLCLVAGYDLTGVFLTNGDPVSLDKVKPVSYNEFMDLKNFINLD